MRETVVIAREDQPGDKRLAAYVVPSQMPFPELGELRGHLKHRLPEYMIPAHFVVLKQLPLSANGKIDRRAPARSLPGCPGLDTAYQAPVGPEEQTLAAIWQEVLGRPTIGRDDSFFELGGDSILAIQVVARAARAGLRLTPRQLFQHPTIAELAAAATDQRKRGSGAGAG